MKIEFGVKARDVITGYCGVVTGHTTYISGCSRVLLAPPVGADGKLLDGEWFDEQRLVEVEGSERIIIENSMTPGFGRAEALKRSTAD